MIYRRSTWLPILAVDVVLFVIAAVIGQHPKQHWKNVFGGIGWFGFLFCTLLLILIAVGSIPIGPKRTVLNVDPSPKRVPSLQPRQALERCRSRESS
jgi:hypothetical protein